MPLRRFEDIVGQIRKDFTKVPRGGIGGTTSPKMMPTTADLGDQYQDERDLDSERSDDDDRERKDPMDVEYEEQVKKMSVLFASYFENVETL
jgi:hypothetical protein